jgi:hypothetical protein
MSKTPLTDEAAVWMESEDDEIGRQYGLVGNVEIVKADFARQLERENAELRKALEAMLDNCCAAAEIRDGKLIIECTESEWKGHVVACDKARAALKEDKR